MPDRGREALRAAWQQVQHRYDDNGGHLTHPRTTLGDIAAVEEALTRHYAAHLTPSPAFAFPEELRELFLRLGSTRHCGGFVWYTPSQAQADTILLNDLWWDEYRPDLGLWTCIAHWSDKHDIWINTQPGHPQYGALVDCHDGHPWLDADPEADSLSAFLLRDDH